MRVAAEIEDLRAVVAAAPAAAARGAGTHWEVGGCPARGTEVRHLSSHTPAAGTPRRRGEITSRRPSPALLARSVEPTSSAALLPLFRYRPPRWREPQRPAHPLVDGNTADTSSP